MHDRDPENPERRSAGCLFPCRCCCNLCGLKGCRKSSKEHFQADITPAFAGMDLSVQHRQAVNKRYIAKTQYMIQRYKTVSKAYVRSDYTHQVIAALSPVIFGIILRIGAESTVKTDAAKGLEWAYEGLLIISLVAIFLYKRKLDEYTRLGLTTEALVAEGWHFINRTGRYVKFPPYSVQLPRETDDAVRAFLNNIETLYSIYIRNKFRGKTRHDTKKKPVKAGGKPNSPPDDGFGVGRTSEVTKLGNYQPDAPPVGLYTRPDGQVMLDLPMGGMETLDQTTSLEMDAFPTPPAAGVEAAPSDSRGVGMSGLQGAMATVASRHPTKTKQAPSRTTFPDLTAAAKASSSSEETKSGEAGAESDNLMVPADAAFTATVEKAMDQIRHAQGSVVRTLSPTNVSPNMSVTPSGHLASVLVGPLPANHASRLISHLATNNIIPSPTMGNDAAVNREGPETTAEGNEDSSDTQDGESIDSDKLE